MMCDICPVFMCIFVIILYQNYVYKAILSVVLFEQI